MKQITVVVTGRPEPPGAALKTQFAAIGDRMVRTMSRRLLAALQRDGRA